MNVRLLSYDEYAWWYNELLCHDFPAYERKPLDNILKLQQLGKYDVYLYEDEKVLGYASIWKLAGRTTYLLDYLGVPASLRNQGIGQVILKDIRHRVIEAEVLSKMDEKVSAADIDNSDFCLILESEAPVPKDDEEENSLRRRRIAFYERNGYIKIYEMGTCGMRFTTMAYEKVPGNLAQVMKDHKEIYGPERTDVVVPLAADVKPPQPFWM